MPRNTSGLLTAFWITQPESGWRLGFGVTAYSLDDAIAIIRGLGYGEWVEDVRSLKIIENVKYDDVEENHVRPNMGPIVVRGMWYPFVRVGL